MQVAGERDFKRKSLKLKRMLVNTNKKSYFEQNILN